MGVMSCHRNNCTNIMCNRYSEEYGYICSECFSELLNKRMGINIEEFMGSAKNNDSEASLKAWDLFCEEIFKED